MRFRRQKGSSSHVQRGGPKPWQVLLQLSHAVMDLWLTVVGMGSKGPSSSSSCHISFAFPIIMGQVSVQLTVRCATPTASYLHQRCRFGSSESNKGSSLGSEVPAHFLSSKSLQVQSYSPPPQAHLPFPTACQRC